MSDWKYIMFEANGRKVPILFPHHLVHDEVHHAIGYTIRQHVIRERPNDWSSKPVSAGFVSGLLCSGTHGKSETMKMESVEEDRSIINTWPYTQGMEDLLGIESKMFEAFRRAMDRED